MEVIISNNILVKNASMAVFQWCRCNLVLDNPEYNTKARLGKWTGGVPQNIYLYAVKGDDVAIPFGCIRKFHEKFGSECHYTVKFAPIRRLNYVSNIKPYDYQENAITAVLGIKNGVLVMPCGSGKTQCGLEVIARVGGKALWLTHTQELLNQSKKRAQSVLSGVGFGTITAGKVSIGTHITFATVQTMCRLDLSEYRHEWDIIVVDECQHCCGSPTRITQFYKVVSNLSARYKLGLTATPYRSDGLEESMFALLGDVIYEVSREDADICEIRVRQIDTGYAPNYDHILTSDGTIDYNRLVEDLTNDSLRFQYISNTLNALSGATIVLGNRVEYLQRLCAEYVANGHKAVCLYSKSDNDMRKRILDELNSGEVDCIFATYQLAKEGLDVPNLRYVVFATPEKDQATIIQSAGRVGRQTKGKEFGTVIDFVDDFPLLKKWARIRRGHYKKIGAKIL